MNIPPKYGLIWYSTSILGSWNSHWKNIGIFLGTNISGAHPRTSSAMDKNHVQVRVVSRPADTKRWVSQADPPEDSKETRLKTCRKSECLEDGSPSEWCVYINIYYILSYIYIYWYIYICWMKYMYIHWNICIIYVICIYIYMELCKCWIIYIHIYIYVYMLNYILYISYIYRYIELYIYIQHIK